jgi:hypothetical protein
VPETEEGVALVVLILTLLAEALAKYDRRALLDTYVDCLAAVRMEKVTQKEPYRI